MTEQEFWNFFKQRGRAPMKLGYMDSEDPAVKAEMEYVGGHALLPKGYDELSESNIIDFGNLLFQDVNLKTKETIIVILAHQTSETALTLLIKYNLKPDKELKAFAKIALDECLMWNE
ncbi:MAG: hypothetical protein KJ561_00755 [Nanoarchaeota archaeon]|nr:hypothetical protein [Nanoarchaeota archaeon]